MGVPHSPATTFSKDRQPATRGNNGRKKSKEIRKLIESFGKTIAPADLLNDDKVKHFLEANDMRGTYNEVLIAKLYAAALYGGEMKAFELIFKTINDRPGDNFKNGNGITINFISPPSIEQEKSIILENDSFSVVTPVDDSTPTP